jgi:hypothetical protein
MRSLVRHFYQHFTKNIMEKLSKISIFSEIPQFSQQQKNTIPQQPADGQ